jgi:hypothetical protein
MIEVGMLFGAFLVVGVVLLLFKLVLGLIVR